MSIKMTVAINNWIVVKITTRERMIAAITNEMTAVIMKNGIMMTVMTVEPKQLFAMTVTTVNQKKITAMTVKFHSLNLSRIVKWKRQTNHYQPAKRLPTTSKSDSNRLSDCHYGYLMEKPFKIVGNKNTH